MTTIYYTISAFIGPDLDDYKDVAGRFTKDKVLALLQSLPDDDTYNYTVKVWDLEGFMNNGESYSEYREQGMLNGEEFVLDPNSILDTDC